MARHACEPAVQSIEIHKEVLFHTILNARMFCVLFARALVCVVIGCLSYVFEIARSRPGLSDTHNDAQVKSRQQHTIARRPSAHHVQALTVMPKSQVEKLRARAHMRYVYLLGSSPVLFRGPPARTSKINQGFSCTCGFDSGIISILCRRRSSSSLLIHLENHTDCTAPSRPVATLSCAARPRQY
eukprot:COSAG05_NODE_2578_length_2878_cov_1.755308_2_plen_185_part_00